MLGLVPVRKIAGYAVCGPSAGRCDGPAQMAQDQSKEACFAVVAKRVLAIK